MLDISRFGSVTDLVTGEVWSGDDIVAAAAARRALYDDAVIGPGCRVVVAYGGTPEFFADLFAIWTAGACAVCVDPELTPGELSNIARFTDAAAVVTGRGTDTSALDPATRVLGPAERTARAASSALTDSRAQDPEPALIFFTSGTTGLPKGVVLTFDALAARIELNQAHLTPEIFRRTLCPLPTHFGHGLIGNVLTPLLGGGDLYLLTNPGLSGGAGLGATISEHGITFMSSTPALWRIALKASPPPCPVLKRVAVGSAPVSPALIDAIIDWAGTDDVWNMYGMTETANWVAGSSARDRRPEDGLVGRMWGGDAAVRLEDGSIVPHGVGEIVIRTPSMMAGYYRRNDLTADAFCDGWYRTGDSGEVSRDGLVRLTGRIKDEINRAGVKVMPEEIDRLLETHEDVAGACTFAIADDIAGEIVGVAIEPAPGADADLAALETWCRARIRKACVPDRWFILPALPRTDRGKLSRDAVRERCLTS